MSLEERAFRKATRRLIPFLFFIYVVAYLDRVNVSFAQLQLEDDLDFSDTIFGLGAGIFSLGYVIFGVPSNLALERFGARRWLAAIMIIWGVISASMVFIEGPRSFYVLRFLLGAAEAGFFPGIILFLTWWFPERERTRTVALFLTAVAAAYVAGGPLSGGLLELDGVAGLEGWQWLFLVEGLPAIALGFVTLRYLDERPRDAEWLEPDERAFLEEEVESERELREALGGQRVRDALGSARVWLLGLIYFIVLAAAFGLTFFVPDLVQDRTGYTDFEVGVLSAVPYGFATVAMVIMARRGGSLVAPVLVGAVGTVITAYAESPLPLTLGITLAAVGLLSALPLFWALPTAFLSGTAAAAGIALIAAVGNLGGFVGPAFTGIAEDQTGSYRMPLVVLAGMLVVCSLLVRLLREERPVARRPCRERRGPVGAGGPAARAPRARLAAPARERVGSAQRAAPRARRLPGDRHHERRGGRGARIRGRQRDAAGRDAGGGGPHRRGRGRARDRRPRGGLRARAARAGRGAAPRRRRRPQLRGHGPRGRRNGGCREPGRAVGGHQGGGRAAGVDVVLNARVDAFLHDDEPEAQVEEAVRRGRLYAEAGADCVYPIGVRGRDAIRRLVEEIGAPLNVLVMPGGLNLAQLAELGVARASFGSGLMHIAMDAAAEQASAYRATGPG